MDDHTTPIPKRPGRRPPLSVSRIEAADMLGVSVDFFDAHIRPRLRVIYQGRRILVPIAELDRWIATNGAPTNPRRAA